MKINIHPAERAVRTILGAVLVSLAFFGPAHPAFLLGVVPLVTGLVGWCPPYALLGISTCPRKEKST